LDIALHGAKTYIETRLPSGSRVVIANTAAPTNELGAYVADELSGKLLNGRRLTVVERSAAVMQTLTAETTYQLSGEVSDATIQSIGQKTGAEAVITGSVQGAGDVYRLNLKITSVRTSELLGYWNATIQADTILNSLIARTSPAKVKPSWIDEPLSARTKYEGSTGGVSSWYYDVGISNKGASEQLARTRARQNVQQVIAENIASDIKARIDITSLSVFASSGIEDVETRIEAALTNSIRTRVPSYEALEWYIENGNTGGSDWYMAYVLVRFPRTDIISMVEKIEPPSIAATVIRQLNITVSNSENTELIRELESARTMALEMIRNSVSR
jgi:TolB-like protein